METLWPWTKYLGVLYHSSCQPLKDMNCIIGVRCGQYRNFKVKGKEQLTYTWEPLKKLIRQMKMWNCLTTLALEYQSLPITGKLFSVTRPPVQHFLGRGCVSSACHTSVGRPLLVFTYRKVIERQNKLGQLPQQQLLTFRNLAGIGII